MPDIRVVNLTKKYGKMYALDNVSLTIHDQEYFSLAGTKRLRQNHAACVSSLGSLNLTAAKSTSATDGLTKCRLKIEISALFSKHSRCFLI